MLMGQSFQHQRITLEKTGWWSYSTHPLTALRYGTSRGTIKNYVCTFDDISARVQAEVALKNNEALLRGGGNRQYEGSGVSARPRWHLSLREPLLPAWVLGFCARRPAGTEPLRFFFHPEDRQRIRF